MSLSFRLVASSTLSVLVVTASGNAAFAQSRRSTRLEPVRPQSTRPQVTPGSNRLPGRTSADRSRAADDRQRLKTTLKVEILTGRGGNNFTAYEWGKVFQKLGVSYRIRNNAGGEKPETKESVRGTFRTVTVIGELDRRGGITFDGRAFNRSDVDKLKEWLDSLKTYGAQGSPEGEPLWGLSKMQFAAVFSALSEPLSENVVGEGLEDALEKLNLPEKYPVRLSTKTREWIRKNYPAEPAVRKNVKGFSTGTGLAMLLNDVGLGFRPRRTPDGGIELAVDPLRETTDVWPIGWEPKKSLQQTAPKLFELIPVEFEKVKLVDVTAAVSAKTGVPIRFDHYRIAGFGVDLEKVVVSHPSRKTSWSLLLRRVSNPHKLTRQIKIDERGTAFVWITSLDAVRKAE